MSTAHQPKVVTTGGTDTGRTRSECGCGWTGTSHSRRTVEGPSLARRDGEDHVRHMAQGPSRYCSITCPHVTQAAS